jgi:RimJ/RimL family protein N-acetyltransferase
MRFYPAPFTREQTEGWVRWGSQHYDTGGFGIWAVVRKEDGLFLGDCGISVQPIDEGDVFEVGYHIRRDCWGRGYATEAARAARDYAFERLGAPVVVSIVDPLNIQSRRVGEKIHVAMREFQWVKTKKTMCLYYTGRADWLGSRR